MPKWSPWKSIGTALAAAVLLAAAAQGAVGEGTAKELPAAPAPELVVGEWVEVEPGVLQRLRVDGAVETRTAGLGGLEFRARELARRIRDMEQRQAVHPDPELREVLDARIQRYDDLVDEILLARARGEGSGGATPMVAASGCTVDIQYHADARPGACGPEAVASGSFYHSCGHFGDVELDSYAQGWHSGLFRTASDTHPRAGAYTSHSDSVSASVVASTTCFSEAEAIVRVQDSLGAFSTWSQQDTNYTCQLAFTAGISGSTSIYVPWNSSGFGSWQASPTGADSYAWYWNGVLVGTGSTYARGFSSTNPSSQYTDSHTLSLTVTRCGQSASTSRTVYVTYEPYSGGGGGSDCPPYKICPHIE